MKVKDLDDKIRLSSVKVKTPNGVIGYLKSQWGKGVWLSDGETTRIYPQFVNDLKDCLEWDITDEPVNCHQKTDFDSIDNTNLKNIQDDSQSSTMPSSFKG